jgi:1-acyl-sn-glycerol-3-phosphate acyltransferase
MSEPVNTLDIKTLLSAIRDLVGEVQPHWKNLHFTPDTHLEKELGLDSMARAELCTRLESSLGIKLDVAAIASATTPNNLLKLILDHRAAATNGIPDSSATDPDNGNASDLLMGSFGHPGIAESSPPHHSPGEWLYALYSWSVLIALALPTWIVVVLAPFESWRRKLGHIISRLFFFLTFTPLRVTGLEHLDPDSTYIVVANHTSYLDGFIVTAALDIPIQFIAKSELARIIPVRMLLQRFGVEFVDRSNGQRGASDVRRITVKSQQGQTIVFFPEGTFTTFPGLQPFRMGAFVTAVRADVPLIPVAISGARSIVRGSEWFPHRGRIDVTIRPPIVPSGEGWQVALNLRDAARAEIANYCGEPDLVEAEYNEAADTP